MARKLKKKVSSDKQIAQIESSFRGLIRRKKSEHISRLPILALIAAMLSSVLLIGAGVFYWYTATSYGRIDEKVTVGDISLGNLTAKEAKALLEEKQVTLLPKDDIIIQIADKKLTLTVADTHLQLNIDAIVEAAFAYGKIRDTSKIDPLDYLKMDTKGIRKKITEFIAPFDGIPVQTTYCVTGVRPDLTKAPSPNESNQVLSVTLGTPKQKVALEPLYTDVVNAYRNRTMEIVVNPELIKPKEINADTLFAEFCINAIDAKLDPITYQITEAIYGYAFDISALKDALSSEKWGETITIDFARITPSITGSMLNKQMFKDVLASYTAYASSKTNRDNNLKLACKSINGIILLPGDEFSYNKTLGNRTLENGYLPAAAYQGGQIIETVGGGICQVSSSLYYCALYADLEILERKNHGRSVSYMDYGLDATVSWGTIDFRFRNNSDHPIRIEASSHKGNVTVKITGVDDKDYYIKMKCESVKTTPFETVYKEYPKDNEFGYKDGDIVTPAQTGRHYLSYRCKYSKTTNKLISQVFEAESVYNKIDKVIAFIPKDPVIPEETTEEATEETMEEATEETMEETTEETTEETMEETSEEMTEGTTEEII